MNEKVRNHWRGVDELYGLYLLCHANGLMHMYLIASSVKIITECNFCPCAESSQPEWFHIETYIRVLQLWFANTAAAAAAANTAAAVWW